MTHVILGLLLSHIISDFYCQTDESCKKKREWHCCEWIIHGGCVLGLSFLAILAPHHWVGALVTALVVMAIHLLIDVIKVKYEISRQGEKRDSIWPFVIDQVLHLIVIFVTTVILFNVLQDYHCWMEIIDTGILLIILVFLAVAKPANTFIRICLKSAKINIGDEPANDDTFHSGRIIGTCERFLIVLFVILTQYEAIGFLVAAKSILRFSSAQENNKSEYVVAGTLLSIAIALVLGLIVVYRTAIGYIVNTLLSFIS
ncbi:MAG: DUF3307 domain-containing protein [Alphaproteobacteria bacterium]|nr:DUF3307 domain-containing protein [Alphaproteobacteria bacterium]